MDLFLLLTPLLVLGVLALVGFLGCDQLLGLQHVPNPPPLAFVQANEGTAQGAVTSIAIAFGKDQASGNFNVVVVSWMDNTASVSFVQDSNGNGAGGNYALAVGPTAGTNLQQSIYYAPNIAAGKSNTVTVFFNGQANQPNLRILEYSGVDSQSPVDVTIAKAGNGLQIDTGFVLTMNAHDLLFAAGTSSGAFNDMTPGYTSRIFDGGHLVEDQFATVAEEYEATATLQAASNWVIQLVAFKSES